MGWVQAPKVYRAVSPERHRNIHGELLPLENTNTNQESRHTYPFVSHTIADEDLPFMTAEIISSKSSPGRLAVKRQTATDPLRRDWWIVVDNIVYDCTDFILEHPGGEQVILSFVGEDCTWQFRRFHSRRILEEIARPLRIGRTEGIKNRFKEPKRLSRLSTSDAW